MGNIEEVKRKKTEEMAENLLWTLVSSKVEELSEVRKMLQGIGYVDDIVEVLAEMDSSEIFQTDFFTIVDSSCCDSELRVSFEMPYILNTYDREEYILRVTGLVTGECIVSNHQKFDWQSLDFSKMTKQEQLNYRSFVTIQNLVYSDCECDDLRVI